MLLDDQIDPDYKKSILQTAGAQAGVKRRKRSKLLAQRADVWSQYEDDETALEQAGECASCDMFRPLDEQGLCLACAGMLERDLIRQRDWEYSATAFLLSDEVREKLRRKVVAEYGEGLELIDPA